MSAYTPKQNRYDTMAYRRCGRSGLDLSAVSLGFWQNFGEVNVFSSCREMVLSAFDAGVTHFDLANNYGPPAGSAERNFGRMLKEDLSAYRDEMVISTKAGWGMWPGPYGDWGSRKYLIASLDQSLKRMGLEYVDIFYHHRPDPNTPLEETMGALDQIVRSGKALYVGISSYNAEDTEKAVAILKHLGTPCLIHQPSYSMLNRWIENGLTDVLRKEGVGCAVFCPLAQGILTDRYLAGIPADSRAQRNGSLKQTQLDEKTLSKVHDLAEIAHQRGQTMAQMALSWCLRDPVVTTVLAGASRLSQLQENIQAAQNTHFCDEELEQINTILAR